MQNLEILDIVEPVYQWDFHVKVVNSVFEYCLGQWKLNERKTQYPLTLRMGVEGNWMPPP